MIKLPLKANAGSNLLELEQRMKKSEGLPNFIKQVEQNTISEFAEVWTETDSLTTAINEVGARMDALNIEVQTKVETVIKPVFEVELEVIQVDRPVYNTVEVRNVVEQPVFEVVEKKVVVENVQELTKLTVLTKQLAIITIVTLAVNVAVTILSILH